MKLYVFKIHDIFTEDLVYLLDYYNLDYILDILINALVEELKVPSSGSSKKYIEEELNIIDVFYVPTLDAMEELKMSIGQLCLNTVDHFMNELEVNCPAILNLDMVLSRYNWQYNIYWDNGCSVLIKLYVRPRG